MGNTVAKLMGPWGPKSPFLARNFCNIPRPFKIQEKLGYTLQSKKATLSFSEIIQSKINQF